MDDGREVLWSHTQKTRKLPAFESAKRLDFVDESLHELFCRLLHGPVEPRDLVSRNDDVPALGATGKLQGNRKPKLRKIRPWGLIIALYILEREAAVTALSTPQGFGFDHKTPPHLYIPGLNESSIRQAHGLFQRMEGDLLKVQFTLYFLKAEFDVPIDILKILEPVHIHRGVPLEDAFAECLGFKVQDSSRDVIGSFLVVAQEDLHHTVEGTGRCREEHHVPFSGEVLLGDLFDFGEVILGNLRHGTPPSSDCIDDMGSKH